MIWNYRDIQQELVWDESIYTRELVLEQPQIFREILTCFFRDEEQKLTLTQNGRPLNLDDDVKLIINPWELNFADKKIIASLSKKISDIAMNENFYLSSNQLIVDIDQYLQEVVAAANLDFVVEMEELTFNQLLKTASLQPTSSSQDLTVMIVDYMNVMRELTGVQLFVFVNLRSFLSFEEIESLCQEFGGRQMQVLLLESTARQALPGVPRLLIDHDWCEI